MQVMVWLPGHLIVHMSSSKWTAQPARVRGETPIRLVPNAGKMWTCRACAGMPDSGRSAVWVDSMTCWFATLTRMGLVVGLRLGRLVLAEK